MIYTKIADALKRYKNEGERGIHWTFFHMSQDEHEKFDDFLVRTDDPLAYMPGTTERRFIEYIKREAERFK